MVTWQITKKLFPAKSPWVDNIEEIITSEGNKLMLTADSREQSMPEGGLMFSFGIRCWKVCVSLNDSSLEKALNIVSLGINHQMFIILIPTIIVV